MKTKKEKKEYEMPLSEAIAEHKRIPKILKKGTLAQRTKEANKQEKELKKILNLK